jgi:rhodanese-related sulfurtransferase
MINKKILLQAGIIILIAFIIGTFYNISNPNRIQFIGDVKNIDFSQSDSLLLELQKQDSILKYADSLKKQSQLREDSIRIAEENRIKDSILAHKKADSLKKIQDSINAANQKKSDTLAVKTNEFIKPVDIKIDFAKALFDKKYKFIDARDVADFNAGHIQGAINIPYHEIEKYKDKLNSLPKDQVYITYCSSACDVSIDMAYYMAKMGFTKVYIFHGGWDEWKNAGFPIN